MGGGIVGFIAGRMFGPLADSIGMFLGSILGLLLSPGMVAALLRKPIPLGLTIITLPAIVVAIVGGYSGQPSVTLLSVVVFGAMMFVAWLVLPVSVPRYKPHECHQCGYDISGLTRCPECGRPVVKTGFREPGLTRPQRWLVASIIIIAGAAFPLALAGMLAYERHRPKTTEELIEQLGSLDMELHEEAMNALAAQGTAPLIRALSHRNTVVRRNAARALSFNPDPSAIEPLRKLLSDPDPWVRQYAQAAFDAASREEVKLPRPLRIFDE